MNKQDRTLFLCPCCGQPTLTELGIYEICEICGWEDDPIQSAECGYAGGANKQSLNDARANWMKSNGRTIDNS